MQKVLPKKLLLCELGDWETNNTSGATQWVIYKWMAVSNTGDSYFSHKERAKVAEWLVEHGYTGCGIDEHNEEDYKRKRHFCPISARVI